MFLYSTGTIYPHERLITPFEAYTWKNHNGDFKAANSQLYKDGYGDPFVESVPNLKRQKK